SHFWDPGASSRAVVWRLGAAGPNYTQEDIVQNSWSAVLTHYFLQMMPQGPYDYSVEREVYRGQTNGPLTIRPDVVVVRMQTTVNPPGGGGAPMSVTSRDILWVECKAPNHDSAHEWKDLIEQGCNRLAQAHPNRMLFVIFGVGLKWMFFKWDPFNNASPLQVLSHNQRLVYEPNVPNQSHVRAMGNNPVPDIIDTRRAYSLNYWQTSQNNQTLMFWQDLLLLEDIIRYIVSINYQGDNPWV
ncbi:uncharacterized protein C8A04DRAFT_16208, partial [Dichotomopilus funicola]